MAESGTVLVTGSAGRIGRAVVRELKARGHAVRGFDRVPTPGARRRRRRRPHRRRGRAPGGQGRAALVHLAATPDDDDFLTQLLPNNIVGVYHVLEAAPRGRRAARGPGQQRAGGLVSALHRAAADRRRRAADAARLVRRHQGLSGGGRPGLRRGARPERHRRPPRLVPAQPRPRRGTAQRSTGAKDVYLSPGDAGRFFACAVEAPADFRFAVVYACSRPLRRSTTTPAGQGPARLRAARSVAAGNRGNYVAGK